MRNDIRKDIESRLIDNDLRIWNKLFPYFRKVNKGTFAILNNDMELYTGNLCQNAEQLDEGEYDILYAVQNFIDNGMIMRAAVSYVPTYLMNPYLVQDYSDSFLFDFTDWIKYWDTKPRDMILSGKLVEKEFCLEQF